MSLNAKFFIKFAAIVLFLTAIYFVASFAYGFKIGKVHHWRIQDASLDASLGKLQHDIRLPTLCNGHEYALDTVITYEAQKTDGQWKLVKVNAAKYRYTEDGWKLRSDARALVSADIVLDQKCFSTLVDTLKYWTGTFRLQLVRAGKVEMEVVKF